ncbi:MAG: VOC family protein [Nitrososphaerales archaeon]|jgi:predicted enzyme related to lactoylglutathione lyase
MVTKTVVHFEIPADNPEKLSKFYSDVFGWKFEKASMPGMDYWMIATGPRNKSVGGGMYKKMGAQDGPKNYVNVDKIDKHIEAFKSAGGKELVGKMEVPKMGWSFIGVDPEGNAIGLFETTGARPRRSTRRKK